MTEIFKTLHEADSSIMKEIFVREDTRYNLKCVEDTHRLKVPRVNLTSMDMNRYLSEAVKFGICLLINLRLYQVCPP